MFKTASLVKDCFELRNTAIRTKECQTKIRALQKTMTILYKELEKYQSDRTEQTVRTLRAMLNRDYKFAGFTRTYVRTHIKAYPDLVQYIA